MSSTEVAGAMTHTVFSFMQAVLPVTPVAPIRPVEAEALAFSAMLDRGTTETALDGPQLDKSEPHPDGSDVSQPGEDLSHADGSTAVPIVDEVSGVTVSGHDHRSRAELIEQPDPQEGAEGEEFGRPEEVIPPTSGTVLPSVLTNGTPEDLPAPDRAKGQFLQKPKAMNDALPMMPRQLDASGSRMVFSGPDLNLTSSRPLVVAEAKPGVAKVPSVSDEELTTGDAILENADASGMHPASAEKNVHDVQTALSQAQNMGAKPGEFPLRSLVASPPAPPAWSEVPILPTLHPEQDVPVAARPFRAESANSVVEIQKERTTLISKSMPATLAIDVMRRPSETALFGFQMRVQETAQASSITAADDMPTSSQPAPQWPQLPPKDISGFSAKLPAESDAESLMQIPKGDGAPATSASALPFFEVLQRHAPFVPSHPLDPTMRAENLVGLRDLPQTVALALHADPAQPGSIQLDPIELGTVAFNMETGPAGLVVTIIAERPETMELLRRHADQFLADLRQSGFQGASLQFGQFGTFGQDQRRAEHMPAPSANSLAATAPQFDTQARTPPSRTGSGLDLRL